VSVWTGTSAAGKSTFLGQELLWAITKGFKVCAFSGELPAPLFRYWVELQAAGPQNLEWKLDPLKDNNVFFPSAETKEKLRAWYQDKFFLIDSFGSADEANMLRMFEYAARRYGCKVFLVDNLMTTIFSGNENDFYRQQGSFVGRLVEFAHRFDVHIHVVAHPRKTKERATKMDIAGTAEITNRADNVFCLSRLSDDDRRLQDTTADTMLDVFKSRFSGGQDVEIELKFCDASRRFRVLSDEDGFERKYGWEDEWSAEKGLAPARRS
jgi:twinkle protein